LNPGEEKKGVTEVEHDTVAKKGKKKREGASLNFSAGKGEVTGINSIMSMTPDPIKENDGLR